MLLYWSAMMYRIVPWGKNSLTYVNKIHSAQDRLIKLIYGKLQNEKTI